MSILKSCLLGTIALCGLVSSQVLAEDDSLLNLEAGGQQVYAHSQPVKRVAVGNPAVAGITMLTSQNILVIGKQAGTTEISLWESEKAAKPARLLKVVVSASTGLEQQRLQLTKSIKAVPAGAGVAISGEAVSLEQHALARQAVDAENKGPLDATHAGFDSQVQIDIKVIEVSRQKMLRAGVNLFLPKGRDHSSIAIGTPGSLGNINFGPNNSKIRFGVPFSSGFVPLGDAYNLVYGNYNSGLLAAISVLEENGFAYTLAEPSLTAISGQSATFLAGGEFPVPIRTGGGSDSSITIQYKEYGVRLMLTPTVLDAHRIFLKVSPEVSELDFNNVVQTGGVAVPGLRVRRTDTSVALGNGESFIISGLVSRNSMNNIDKLPWLGDIPIIGAFFRSTRFDREDKELLMVVTPYLVRPIARDAGTPALPGGNLRDYNPSFSELFFQTGTRPDTGLPATGVSR
ncbi:Secretin PulD [Methylophilaceae bacterium]|nr:Secretin PulD [Methylophilaceae bacterium]